MQDELLDRPVENTGPQKLKYEVSVKHTATDESSEMKYEGTDKMTEPNESSESENESENDGVGIVPSLRSSRNHFYKYSF